MVAGGGSMLTLPTLILLGMPPTVANGTNRVGLVIQNIGAIESFRRHGLVKKNWIVRAALPAIPGALLGAWVGVSVSDDLFRRVLSIAMLAVALWTILGPGSKPQFGEDLDADAFPGGRLGMTAAFFAAGFYGGLVQVGFAFIVLAIVSAAAMDLVRGNALKILVSLLFNSPAVVVYWWNGMVNWTVGALLGSGYLIGGLVGVHLNVLKGQTWVKRVVTVAVIVLAIRLLIG